MKSSADIFARLLRLLIIFSCVLFANIAGSMAKHVLFSPVNGIVTMNGVPVVGAKVERSYVSSQNRVQDEALTDKNGTFSFGVLTGFSIGMWLPGEVVINQEIIVHYKGVAHTVWNCSKRNYSLNSELGGREIKVQFQLEMERREINYFCFGKFVLNLGGYSPRPSGAGTLIA